MFEHFCSLAISLEKKLDLAQEEYVLNIDEDLSFANNV